MKYLIGITCSLSKTQNIINTAYIRAFTTNKTTPILIPNIFDFQNEIISDEENKKIEQHAELLAKSLDALVLSGGADINPTSFGDIIKSASTFSYARDYIETILISAFVKENKPILGICRGFQLLGQLYGLNYWQQDISITKEEHNGNNNDISNRKEPMHNVMIFNSFAEYCKTKGASNNRILTNSWHEQGFSLMPSGGRVKTKDIQDFITEKSPFTDEKCKSPEPVNKFGEIEIIMATNHVIEGFQHKELKIVAFQNHPEEYNESIAIKYFIEKYIVNEF